jgi:hypothetical protein
MILRILPLHTHTHKISITFFLSLVPASRTQPGCFLYRLRLSRW